MLLPLVLSCLGLASAAIQTCSPSDCNPRVSRIPSPST